MFRKKWVFGEKFKRQSTRLEDSLSWEEIRARKHRRKVIVSSSEPSSSLVLFFFRSASSLSTPVAQATPSPCTFPPMVPLSTQCGLLLHLVLRAVTRYAVIHTGEISGKVSDLLFDLSLGELV